MPEPKVINHPVREIVLPFTLVITIMGNVLFVGFTWGKWDLRMEITERNIAEEKQNNRSQDAKIQEIKDKIHDLSRDVTEDRRRFILLDDYTRGRIDDLPYKPPPPARW